jgi:hypothetical protein
MVARGVEIQVLRQGNPVSVTVEILRIVISRVGRIEFNPDTRADIDVVDFERRGRHTSYGVYPQDAAKHNGDQKACSDKQPAGM